MQVKRINSLDRQTAVAELTRCCGSPVWVQEMAERLPFTDERALLAAAEEIWWKLPPAQWLAAFSHHPKIGDVDNLRKKFASTADWSSKEQSGVAGAAEQTLAELAEGNQQYEQKFGYIFIVCATGKTAEEMLALLKARLPNDPDVELKIAAGEQSKITRIRLEKLCQEVPSQPTC